MTEAELYTVYKGVYVPSSLHPPESLKYYEEFSFRSDDVIIVTYPKSGKRVGQSAPCIFKTLMPFSCTFWRLSTVRGHLATFVLCQHFKRKKKKGARKDAMHGVLTGLKNEDKEKVTNHCILSFARQAPTNRKKFHFGHLFLDASVEWK